MPGVVMFPTSMDLMGTWTAAQPSDIVVTLEMSTEAAARTPSGIYDFDRLCYGYIEAAPDTGIEIPNAATAQILNSVFSATVYEGLESEADITE